MHQITRLIVVLTLILLIFGWASNQSPRVVASVSPDRIWQDVPEANILLRGPRQIVPLAYRTVRADLTALDTLLASAPLEILGDRERGAIIALPLPNGAWGRFRFQESPLMQPGLAAKFPLIKTYLGQGLDDPAAVVRFDRTPAGFHALILSPSGSVFIDPYSTLDTLNYISYYRDDFQDEGSEEFVETAVEQDDPPQRLTDVVARSSGDTLRTYRLAVGATGEYTQFHGGTVPSAMAAIVTTMNRVVGVYEREVAIRMILVDNNESVVFTNPTLDPYENDDGTVMLVQNQVVLDTLIGDGNYDIGHVFSTGGGGVAFLEVPCETGRKAGGVTGRGSPVGDPFDIDYVAHEMGHQFGGEHTFNGTTGSCGGGNRSAGTAYEPGSGTTIMAYAGICDAEDVQPNSDPYFHTGSFDQIVAFSTNPTTGGSCAVETATNNRAPVVSAGPDYLIPANTPFSLVGSATDPDNDPLTYDWEQFDTGNPAPPNTDDGTRAIFRSFNPVLTPDRTFPQLANVLNNTSTFGESLPTTNRELTFRLTARDNRAAGGGVDYDTASITVTNSAGPFLVTSPNTAVTWDVGTSQTVTWDKANTDVAPVNCSLVDILLSTDGGLTFPITLANDTANDGTETITVPNNPSAAVRVKVVCATNIFFDIGDTSFTIRTAPGVDPATSTPTPSATSTATPELTEEPTRQPPIELTSTATATSLVTSTATDATSTATSTATSILSETTTSTVTNITTNTPTSTTTSTASATQGTTTPTSTVGTFVTVTPTVSTEPPTPIVVIDDFKRLYLPLVVR